MTDRPLVRNNAQQAQVMGHWHLSVEFPASCGVRSISRRAVLAGIGGALFTAGVISPPGSITRPAHAQSAAPRGPQAPVTVSMDALMEPDGLRDFTIGSDDAPVTIIEYASMTCGHCARFHNDVLPELKARYIDTGKARLVFRDFPLDLGAAWGSMIGHCADDSEEAIARTNALFKRQEDWAFGGSEESVRSGLVSVLEPFGMTEAAIETCVSDQILLHSIAQRAVRAGREFGVTSTPTFFINGLKLEGVAPVEAFAEIIDPLL
jgi:protein-disulfide isomerase